MSHPCQPTVFSRRDFLGRTACGAAAATWAGSFQPAVGAAAAPWPMRLSCSSINFSSLPIEQACQRIAALGFEAVDIWSAHAGCPHLDDVAKRLGPAGLKDLLARHRLKLYAFSVYVGGYRRYAELLGQAGGGVAVRGSAPESKPAELTARMKAFLETLKPEIELAEDNSLSGDREPRGRFAQHARLAEGLLRAEQASPSGPGFGALSRAGNQGLGRGGDRRRRPAIVLLLRLAERPGPTATARHRPDRLRAVAGRAGPGRLSLVRHPLHAP